MLRALHPAAPYLGGADFPQDVESFAVEHDSVVFIVVNGACPKPIMRSNQIRKTIGEITVLDQSWICCTKFYGYNGEKGGVRLHWLAVLTVSTLGRDYALS